MSISECREHYNKAARCPPSDLFMADRRHAHNAVKSQAISHAVAIGTCSVPYRVLDLACGRGGDYVKHAKRGACAAYYGVDVADEAIDELERRVQQCRCIPSVHVYCGDACDIPWKGSSVNADICTVNFALHYFFDNRKHLDHLLSVVSRSLKDGCIFVGTYMDWRALPSCNEAMSDKKWPTEEELADNPFGHVYHYKMGRCVDAKEYVVHIPTLCTMAQTHGLYLVLNRSFRCFVASQTQHSNNCQHGQFVFMFRKCRRQ